VSSEEKDSLRSTSFARIIDLLGEGEIGGLVNGARSIYLDDTPLQNADGSFNFSGVKYVERKGTADQDYIPGFPGTEKAVAVNVRAKENIPIVRTISDSSVDAVNVILSVPALQRTDKDDGDVVATSVRLLVEVQPNGGAWQAFGSSSTPVAMSAVSSTQVIMPASTATIRADMTVAYTQSDGSAFQSGSFTIEYREAGTSTWTTWLTGAVYAGTTKFDKDSATTTYSGTQTFSRADLVQNRYEFRVINTSGHGTMTLAGTYYKVSSVVTISGKASSKYQRQVMCILPAGGAPWNVRVTRLDDDSDSQYLQNDTYWDSYVEITDEKLRMPHSAAIAVTLDGANFSSIPNRAYDVYLRLVQVPVNYNPLTRVYTGSWDGTFKTAWTDNPAWVFYDLLTHPRYGLGEFVGTGVDKWALYQIGRYCDELVPDGFGATEPRFTCNIYLASRAEAYKLVQDLASVFRGMVFWGSGSITSIQDTPSDPVALYTPANVINGMFNYSGSSAKARHTAALVTWNDPADMCRQKVEYVEDRAGIDRFGLILTEVVAVGCTRRGQAARVGRWLLYSELAQTDVVVFKTALEGVRCRPGQVIKIADPARAGVRYGGRLLAATTTSVTIDAPVELLAGQTYTLSTLKADGSTQDAAVTTAAGTGVSTLTVSPAMAEAPTVGSMWVLGCDQVEPQLFQVLTVTEAGKNEFEINAIVFDPSKFDAVELGLTLEPRSISLLKTKPDAPANIAITEALYAKGQVLATRLDVSWTAPVGAASFAVSWRRDDGAASGEQITSYPGLDIDNAQEGQTYTVTVYAVNLLGVRSAEPATITHVVVGKQAPPANVEGFVVARTTDALAFSWRPIADLDAARYEVRRGDRWETSIIVGSAPHPTNALSVLMPRGGTFLIKAIDTSGNESVLPAAIIAPDVSGLNVVLSYEEATGGFTGAMVGAYEYVATTSPAWDGTGTWGDASTWDAFTERRGVTLVAGGMSGTYTSEVVDIGYVATPLVSIDATVEALGPLTLPWSSYTLPWASYAGPDWVWQAGAGEVSAAYEVSTSEDGTSWTPWATFTPGAYRFRYLRARVTLASANPQYRPFMTSLLFSIDVPDRIEHVADVAVPPAGATITFSPAFVGVSTVQVTLQSAAAGDTCKVTAKSATSVTVQVVDSTGTPKAGLLDVDVFGYGERF
jgi:predicted phage tail protein